MKYRITMVDGEISPTIMIRAKYISYIKVIED